MSSGCMNSVGCVDARVPVRASYVNLYKWPESDVEFVRSMARGDDGRVVGGGCGGGVRRFAAAGPVVVDSFSCRQMYLRSYPFKRKETVPEKTRRCIDKVKERAALFNRHGRDNSSTTSQKSYEENKKIKNTTKSKRNSNEDKTKKKKKKKKGAKRLKDASCSALYSMFRRLLSCTASFDVVDGHQPQ